MRAADDLRVTPRRYGDRRLRLFRACERALRLAGGRRWYRARHLARGRFTLRAEEIAVRDLPRGLDGLCVAQLSDLHGGPFVGAGDLDEVVAAVNALRPDVCALTGDFITHHWREALPLVAALGGLVARHGTFAVFGNHDYKDRQEGRIVAALAERGVRFLRNDSAVLDTGDGALRITGLEDLEQGRALDLAAARRGMAPGDLELVLCHNPLGASALARPGCLAVLAGHSHGTQVDLPFLRELGPAHPGLRVELGPTTLIVSRGLGVVGLPWRHRSPAEVVLVTLRRAPGGRGGRAG